ncbi:hypothetical protein [Terriglobus saanensis]|uniref:Uncharacterized protein n=1 Tax=Terriglobus saanensis (strain ATCC BAA-1853 / DSM 23119 / SP1PR4) TaxID=401053 RepID=E8V6Q8_TERSS|nr:hypothetical protein [Terriglobus saanensis]ADV83860.1 hypothetical protein AciPR4_3102 [Terriglobus saanensis SP1PR4]
MNWILDKDRFDHLYLEAKSCVDTDSGRLPTAFKRLTFDDAQICTIEFANMLQELLKWSGDPYFSYVVLKPDPIYYFHRLFNAFPAIEVGRGATARDYIKWLNDGPEESPADALGTNCTECVIVPPSKRWFVHAVRSALSDGGHLWMPSDWVDRAVSMYPYLSAIAIQ